MYVNQQRKGRKSTVRMAEKNWEVCDEASKMKTDIK